VRFSIILIFAIAMTSLAADKPAPLAATTASNFNPFGYAEVYIDAGTASLAAYQVEIIATDPATQIVSIEGGEHPAFNPAPYYDPIARDHNRIIIAAFSTSDVLPHGRTRVARIHVFDEKQSPAQLHYTIRLMAAGDADAHRIEAMASIQPGEQP